jgi:hypothetical protein
VPVPLQSDHEKVCSSHSSTAVGLKAHVRAPPFKLIA